MSRGWIEDDLPFDDGEEYLERGDTFDVTGKSWEYPDWRYPIGFKRDKPIVRVKAHTVPIPDRGKQ